MNPILNEKNLFDAIDQGNAFLVKQYVDLGGDVQVRSEKGLTPLAATALLLHKEKIAATEALYNSDDEDEEDPDDPNNLILPPQQPVSIDVDETSMSKESQASLEIGVILLSSGCSLEERMGKTNRTVTVEQFMKNFFPDVLKSWSAVWSGQQIRQEISETVDIESRPTLGPRKI